MHACICICVYLHASLDLEMCGGLIHTCFNQSLMNSVHLTTDKVFKSELSGCPNAIKVDLALHPVFGALTVIGRQSNEPERAGYLALLAAAIGI